jgi:lipopolysaccharide export system protein LptA
MCFKTITVTAFLGISLCFLICMVHLFSISDADEKAYRQLVESVGSTNSNSKILPYQAQQQRKGDQKDIVMHHGKDLLHIRLASADSLLVLNQNEQGMEVHEVMKNFTGLMQENVYPLASGQQPVRQIHYKADQAVYNDKKIELNGNVVVESEFGKISAKEIELALSSSKKKCLQTLDITGDVYLYMKDGGILQCEKAWVDYQDLTGKFEGKSEGYVVYTEHLENPQTTPDKKSPLVVRSKRMSVQIAKKKEKKEALTDRITNLQADGSVTIDYNQDFIAQGDLASYNKHSKLDSDQSMSLGVLVLDAVGPKGICRVTNRNQDFIDALQIQFNTAKRELFFANPQGSFHINQGAERKERVDFSSKTLSWDVQKGVLIFKEDVVLDQEGFGRLTNAQEVKIIQVIDNQKDQLNTFESEGTTELRIIDPTKEVEHHLICYGKMKVNHSLFEVIMESPVDSKGQVIPNLQVYFKDQLGEIHADKLTMKYEVINKVIQPKQILLEGNVSLLSKNAVHSEDSSPIMQYALADYMEYYPKSKELIFSSRIKGHRVLFYDKINDLQVSAPSLKIKRDEITKKDLVKGSGDVRFNFIENEFTQLSKRFSSAKFREKIKNELK